MEDPQFTVLLTGTAYSGPPALRAIREVTGLSLWHSRRLPAGAPATVLDEVPYESAAAALLRLRGAGVEAAVRCTCCSRTLPVDGAPVDPAPCRAPYWPTAHCQANSETVCDLDDCPGHDPDRQRGHR